VQGAPAIATVYRYMTVDRMAASSAVKKAVGFLAVLLMVTLFAGGARKSPEIKGLIMTRDFVIPAGQSVTAVQDTMILASRKIEIYGTLFVSPGMNVTFRSPTVDIQGNIQHIPSLIGRLQIAMMHVKSFEQSIYQPQPPVPQTWPGRTVLSCNTFTRKSPAQTPPTGKSPLLPAPGN
jgi:hypothetical protein